jgi:hypothetical protein
MRRLHKMRNPLRLLPLVLLLLHRIMFKVHSFYKKIANEQLVKQRIRSGAPKGVYPLIRRRRGQGQGHSKRRLRYEKLDMDSKDTTFTQSVTRGNRPHKLLEQKARRPVGRRQTRAVSSRN